MLGQPDPVLREEAGAIHRCQLADPARQRSHVVAHTRRVALQRPQLAEHAEYAALAHLRERMLDFLDRGPAARRAQKFPVAATLRIALSSSASASSRFRRAFSCSSAFRRFACPTFIPPQSFGHRKYVESVIARNFQTAATVPPRTSSTSA